MAQRSRTQEARMKMRWVVWCSLLIVVVLWTGLGWAQQPRYGGTLRLALEGDPAFYDANQGPAPGAAAGWTGHNIYNSPKSAERPRHSCRGWIGVGRAGLNAQEPNKTHAVPEPSMGEGTAEVEAPAFMPGRMSRDGKSHIPSDLVVDSWPHMLRAAQPLISR